MIKFSEIIAKCSRKHIIYIDKKQWPWPETIKKIKKQYRFFFDSDFFQHRKKWKSEMFEILKFFEIFDILKIFEIFEISRFCIIFKIFKNVCVCQDFQWFSRFCYLLKCVIDINQSFTLYFNYSFCPNFEYDEILLYLKYWKLWIIYNCF